MLIGPLTIESIGKVFENLSEQSRKEFALCGKTVEQVKARFYELVGAEFTAVLCDSKGAPLALVCLEHRALDTWRANLVMSEGAWKKIGLAMTFFFARFTKDFVTRSGGVVEAYSPDSFGKIFDWYTGMGFHYDGLQDGLARYVKRAG